MRGAIILRLVDITLLLLLSLMATASFTTSTAELPISTALTDRGALMQPMQIELTSDGRILAQDQVELTLSDLEMFVKTWPMEIELVADADASAGQLLGIHAIARQHDRLGAFRVQRRGSP